MKRLYASFIVWLTLSCWFDTADAQVVNIPDPNLAAVVREALGLAPNTVITRQAMQTLTSLDAFPGAVERVTGQWNEIKNITGLQHATQLRSLSISGNEQINDLRPLAGLTQLEELHISVRKIGDLSPHVDLTRCKVLGLDGWFNNERNQFSDLHLLANLTQLSTLYVINGRFSDLSFLRGLTQLRGLWLDGEEISDLTPLKGLTQLTFLDLANNKIRDVSPLAGLSNLEYLYLKGNPIQNVSVLANLPNLQDVDFNIPPVISITRDDNSSEVPSVGQTLKYRVQIRKAWNVTGFNLNYTVPHKLTSVKSVEWFDRVEHNSRRGINGTLTASRLETGQDIRNIAIFTLNATAAGKGELRVEGRVTTTYGTIQVRERLPLTIFSPDEPESTGIQTAVDSTPQASSGDECNQKLTDPNIDQCGTWINLEPLDLEQLQTLRSRGGDNETEVIFVNLTRVNLSYYWIDYEGNEILYGVVAANDFVKQSAYAGHVWLVKDPNGKNLAVYRAVEKDGRAIINALLSPVVQIGPAQRPPVYWIDAGAGTLHRLIGDEVEDLLPDVQNATNLALDTTDNKIYWTEQTGKNRGRIKRANLDGSNVQLLATLKSVPTSIAVDATNGKFYGTNTRGRIQRANLDGNQIQNLIANLEAPSNITLEAAGGKLYWTEASGRIRRANLNGKSIQNISDNLDPVSDIVIAGNKMYWTEIADGGGGKIRRANLNGSNFNTLITLQHAPLSIAIDSVGNKLYWTDSSGSIQRANLNGKRIQNVVSGLASPTALVLGGVSAGPAAPVNNGFVSSQRASPDTTHLLANYPNPFNPETWIPYELARDTDVRIMIYNAQGVVIRTLQLGQQSAGYYTGRARAAYWDGRNMLGEHVASGIYFYQLQTGDDFSATKKMLIRK